MSIYMSKSHARDDYSTYTKVIIETGHSFVCHSCSEISKEKGHPLTILDIGCGSTEIFAWVGKVVGEYVGNLKLWRMA